MTFRCRYIVKKGTSRELAVEPVRPGRMAPELSCRLLRRDVAQQESLADHHQGKVGRRHDEVDRQRHGDEEGERDRPRRRLPKQNAGHRGTVAPTASTAYCTKSMPAATAMAVTYPTTRYPAARESQLERL